MLTLKHGQGDTWLLKGQVTVDTITGVLPSLKKMIHSESKTLVMDLSQVERVDSASVALLLQGLRWAKMASKTLTFTHYPQKMRDIIHVSNLEDLLS